MLEVTVKTLDSQSRSFSVDDDIMVRDFKQHIASSVNIAVERQRLIFQGQVLRDDTKLNEGRDVNGKVIHLVERLPVPVQPTPAEQARAQQTTTQANAQPRPPPPPVGNLLGPFPMPGPDSNYQQLVQQMIQQALVGVGTTVGPAVIRGTVRHPNAPGVSASTEIQIQIAPHGAGAQGGNQTRPQAQPSQPQQSTPNQQPSPVRTASAQPHPVVQSEPRRQLQNVEQLLTKLEENVVTLENKSYEQAQQSQDGQSTSAEGAAETEGTSSSGEPMDQDGQGLDSESTSEGTVTAEQTSSSGAAASNSRHPALPEVGAVMRRVHGLESRFLPFLLQYTEFLENDPAFSSTENPEYKAMMGFLTVVLRTQRTLCHIHRILSAFAIPLVETPPRRMLMQGPCPAHRGPPPNARRINRVVSAGSYLNQPRMRTPQHHHHHHHPPPGTGTGVRLFVSPVRGGGAMGPGIIGFGPGEPRPVRPHQSGLYGYPEPTVVTSTTSSQSPNSQRPQAAVSGSSMSTTASTGGPSSYLIMSESGSLHPAPGALVDEDAEPMTIRVATHIHPQINITIYADSLPPEGRPDRIPLFGVTGRIEADEQGNVLPMELHISDIPGVPEIGIREMEANVRENILRALNVMNLIPQQLGHQREEMQRTQNARQSSDETGNVNIARLVGQNVHSALMQLRHGQSSTSTTSSTTTTPTASASARPTFNPQLVPSRVTVISSSPGRPPAQTPEARPTASTSTPTTAPLSAIDAHTQNLLANIMNQITGGGAGNTGAAAAAPQSSNAKVRGHSGRERKEIPTIRRTPNCVNDIVRGQGYPEEMMALTEYGSILALVLFLAGELLTIPDCLSFMSGATEPGDRLGEPLRTAVSECWFDGGIPTRDQIEEEVERHSDEARDIIKRYFEGQEPKSSDIDIIESNLSLYRFVLRKLLNLLYLAEPGQFAEGILRHLMDSFNLIIHLNIHILRGAEEAVTNLVLNNMGTALDPFSLHSGSGENQPSDPVVASLRTLLGANLIPFARSRPVSQDQIDQFVMNVQTDKEPEQESVAPPPEVEEVTPSDDLKPTKDKKEEDEANFGTSSTTASDSQPSTEEKESTGPVVEQPAMNMDVDVAEGITGAARMEPDWRTMVPREWISIIESDVERQKSLPEQPPFSDAYMAGTPASKRRKI